MPRQWGGDQNWKSLAGGDDRRHVRTEFPSRTLVWGDRHLVTLTSPSPIPTITTVSGWLGEYNWNKVTQCREMLSQFNINPPILLKHSQSPFRTPRMRLPHLLSPLLLTPILFPHHNSIIHYTSHKRKTHPPTPHNPMKYMIHHIIRL